MFLNSGLEKLYDFSFLMNSEVVLGFAKGLGITLSVAALGLVIGISLGILLAVAKLVGNKFLKGLATVYINFVRGTPLLVQLYLIAYVPDFISMQLTGHPLLQFNGAIIVYSIIAVGLNSAAYVAEIFRAGILSIDKGQFEASYSLGLNYVKTLKIIILPQAIKNILPALGNEFISVVKETAIISVIAATDLMFFGKQIANTLYNPFAPIFFVAIVYFIVVYCLTKLVNIWEGKLKND